MKISFIDTPKGYIIFEINKETGEFRQILPPGLPEPPEIVSVIVRKITDEDFSR